MCALSPSLPNKAVATQAGEVGGWWWGEGGVPLIPDKQVSLAARGGFFLCLALERREGPGLNEGGPAWRGGGWGGGWVLWWWWWWW